MLFPCRITNKWRVSEINHKNLHDGFFTLVEDQNVLFAAKQYARMMIECGNMVSSEKITVTDATGRYHHFSVIVEHNNIVDIIKH